jgi:predicted CXXCH cytochrome family protein
MTGRGARALVCAAALVSAACSYRTLRIFFDGVPEPGHEPAPRAAGSAAPLQPGETSRATGSQHGPYAAKQCDGCHTTGRSNALVVPADQLCARCHELSLNKRFVHGPLAAGGCLLCHDPHSSQYAFLLVADSRTFCFRCHEARSLREIQGHESGGPPCTSCHEAHMSDRRFLLR